jgi:hypothetical protein
MRYLSPVPCLKISCGLTILVIALLFSAHASAADIVLQDSSMRVAFDSHSGALTELEYKTTHWRRAQRYCQMLWIAQIRRLIF